MTAKDLKIVLAQLNPIVGDIEYNTTKIRDTINNYKDADIVIFPEMFLVGYPLMDHIFDPIIRKKNAEAIEKIRQLETNATIILGTFTESSKNEEKLHPFYNSALIIEHSKIRTIIHKRLLPDYDVFNERRYFTFDADYNPIRIKGVEVGILICEDIWDDNYSSKVARNLKSNGAELLVVINASPYHINKFKLRRDLLSKKSKELSIPIIYLNMVGGLDEIVYDGCSFAVNQFGQLTYIAKAFEESLGVINLKEIDTKLTKEFEYNLDWRERVLKALKLNLHDYYYKSNIFKGVVLGVSGGVDSAFTAYICAEALGYDKVTAIMMPTRFTSSESLNEAKKLCNNLKINYTIHPIDDLFKNYEDSIQQHVGQVKFDIADENLQARIRATLLMYYSNKFDWLLISTGNKSEIGVGYCTLYGDTNGGKNVPGDLLKGQIYELCEYINREKEIIPINIIQRAPTAELRENQKDSDSLPPYEILDRILEDITHNGIGADLSHLKKEGIDLETIEQVERLYLNSEYKRRQLVQSIKVSESAFGIGRKYPVLKRINLKG